MKLLLLSIQSTYSLYHHDAHVFITFVSGISRCHFTSFRARELNPIRVCHSSTFWQCSTWHTRHLTSSFFSSSSHEQDQFRRYPCQRYIDASGK